MSRAWFYLHLANIVGSPLFVATVGGAPVSTWWQAATWPLAAVACHAFLERYGYLVTAPGPRGGDGPLEGSPAR